MTASLATSLRARFVAADTPSGVLYWGDAHSTLFAVWACHPNAVDQLHAVFSSEKCAVLEATIGNKSDPVYCYRVAPVTYTA